MLCAFYERAGLDFDQVGDPFNSVVDRRKCGNCSVIVIKRKFALPHEGPCDPLAPRSFRCGEYALLVVDQHGAMDIFARCRRAPGPCGCRSRRARPLRLRCPIVPPFSAGTRRLHRTGSPWARLAKALKHVQRSRKEAVGERIVDQVGRHAEEADVSWMFDTIFLQRAETVPIARAPPSAARESPKARSRCAPARSAGGASGEAGDNSRSQ